MSDIVNDNTPGLLEPGQDFPELRVSLLDGNTVVLPSDLEDAWSVLLFYRGNWCPYCRQQLADFQKELARFEAQGVGVVALSADPEDEARATVEKHGLTFPVAYGLDPREVRRTVGAYLDEEDAFIQATGFVLTPAGTVALAVYSSGAVGRLVAGDVLGLIQYMKSQEAS